MSEKEPIESIKRIGGSAPTKHIEEPIAVTGEANKAHFDALMDQKAPQKIEKTEISEAEKNATIFDEVSKDKTKIDAAAKGSIDDIRTNIDTTLGNIKGIKEDLETPNLHIKPYKQQMRSKLSHIDESLKIALSKAGSEVPSEQPSSSRFDPVREFIGRLSHIEYQMEDMGNYLSYMAENKQEISPANLLAIQIKVTHIGQEVEFFAGLLSKSLESTKTLMNVQV